MTRREFAHVTVRAGLTVSAAIWVAPQLSSVALAQDAAGSPPPPTSASRPSEPPFESGAQPGVQRAARTTGGATQGGGGAGAGGIGAELPLTGADVRKLAATGGAAVLTGSALVAGERLSKRVRSRPKRPAEGSSDETAQ